MSNDKKQKVFENLEDNIMSTNYMFNEVKWSALSYLSHAETSMRHQSGEFGVIILEGWYVVHHLSYISVELFLKSFFAKYIVHDDEELLEYNGWEDGYYEGVYITSHSLRGHFGIHNYYPDDLTTSLKSYLSDEEWNLIESMSDREFSRGRYPYEDMRNQVAREEASSWLSLAQKLSKFEYII